MRTRIACLAGLAVLLTSACSLKRYAINMVGDALATGNSVYETDEDIQFVGEALPFGMKLVESLLLESPNHRGLLITASRGFVLYSFAYVDYPAEVMADEDLDRAREMRTRARKLYLRALDYGLRGLEHSYPGFSEQLKTDPQPGLRTFLLTGVGLAWRNAPAVLNISGGRFVSFLSQSVATSPVVRIVFGRGVILASWSPSMKLVWALVSEACWYPTSCVSIDALFIPRSNIFSQERFSKG